MFTKNNTMNEILNTEPVGRAAGNLFPTCFMARVPVEHRDHTMAQIEKEETMEWGAPFLADAFLECANLIKETAETKKFKYIPLWGENDDASAGDKMSHWKNGIPDADLNTEEGVWLFTGDPAVDNEAFAHTAGSDSIPPYESVAVSKEKRNTSGLKPAVILCPGGGYEMTSDREAEPVAIQYIAKGYQAAILRYSVKPAKYPLALLQLAKAVAHLREYADEYHIDTEKIVVQGFSAGGHLACSLGVFWKKPFLSETLGVSAEQIRPNGMILCYPVITSGEYAHRGSFEALLGEDAYDPEKRKEQSLELQMTKDTPPTFLWHTEPDDCVPVENSLFFFEALHKNKIPVEMHIYPAGGHGLSLANEETKRQDGSGIQPECQSWMELACGWMSRL